MEAEGVFPHSRCNLFAIGCNFCDFSTSWMLETKVLKNLHPTSSLQITTGKDFTIPQKTLESSVKPEVAKQECVVFFHVTGKVV
jgi:hypothetical protein